MNIPHSPTANLLPCLKHIYSLAAKPCQVVDFKIFSGNLKLIYIYIDLPHLRSPNPKQPPIYPVKRLVEAYVCSSQSSNWNVATWESHGMMVLRNQSARFVFGGLIIGRPKCNSCFLSKQQNRLWFAWCFELFEVPISFASSMNLLIYHETSHQPKKKHGPPIKHTFLQKSETATDVTNGKVTLARSSRSSSESRSVEP